MNISRRNLIKSFGTVALLGAFPAFPGLSFANINGTDKRFILVILRGGMDGLAAVAPYGDPDYAEARGEGLAYAPNEVLDLDGFFGLSPALDSLKKIYNDKQLAVIHAVGLPFRSRSHFDSQNVLENGTSFPAGSVGWLNKALKMLGANDGEGIALNQQIPLVLQGVLGVASWAPKDENFNVDLASGYIDIITKLYKQDPLLAEPFAAGIAAQKMAESSLPADDLEAAKNAKDADVLLAAAKAAVAFIIPQTGPKVAVLEAGGWDTHINQGRDIGVLANRLKYLGDALAALRDELVKGGVWDKTVVTVVTEFGRTVKENGTKGTDHGTGSVAFVIGGKVKGGKVFGEWPTLAGNKLFKGRDLMPTTDMRSIFKTVLVQHFGAKASDVDANIFPVPNRNPNPEPDADPVSRNVMSPVPLINGLLA